MLRTNDVSDIDRNVFNALVLPRSLFVSFKEKSEENNRVAFTAYKDDVLFYVSICFGIFLTEIINRNKQV